MDISTILSHVKSRLGINSTARDSYITFIINSVISELSNIQGLTLNSSDTHHMMVIVDYAEWRYRNAGSKEGMPRFIQFELHNLIIKQAGTVTVDE